MFILYIYIIDVIYIYICIDIIYYQVYCTYILYIYITYIIIYIYHRVKKCTCVRVCTSFFMHVIGMHAWFDMFAFMERPSTSLSVLKKLVTHLGMPWNRKHAKSFDQGPSLAVGRVGVGFDMRAGKFLVFKLCLCYLVRYGRRLIFFGQLGMGHPNPGSLVGMGCSVGKSQIQVRATPVSLTLVPRILQDLKSLFALEAGARWSPVSLIGQWASSLLSTTCAPCTLLQYMHACMQGMQCILHASYNTLYGSIHQYSMYITAKELPSSFW